MSPEVTAAPSAGPPLRGPWLPRALETQDCALTSPLPPLSNPCPALRPTPPTLALVVSGPPGAPATAWWQEGGGHGPNSFLLLHQAPRPEANNLGFPRPRRGGYLLSGKQVLCGTPLGQSCPPKSLSSSRAMGLLFPEATRTSVLGERSSWKTFPVTAVPLDTWVGLNPKP